MAAKEPAMRLAPALGLIASLMPPAAFAAAEPAEAAKAPEADRPVAVHLKAEPAQALYRSQLLGELDHAIGDHLVVAGLTIPARLDPKGNLELDLKGDGKFTTYARPATIAVPIPQDGGKRTFKLQLHLDRAADKAWTYRTVTQLSMQAGQDGLVVVDVNGDGTFNQPGIDGLCWAGSEWVFPLPAADERWCTPGLDLTGLAFGALGEDPHLSGRVLATTRPEALPVLLGVNRERVKLGLTPRPEDAKLSADLQQHCHYMALNKQLTHPEDSGKPGYTAEGNAAGMRSILGMGTAAENLALVMVGTYFHRQDVIRPESLAFGVGYDGAYGGIDGRSKVGHAPAAWWPVLCPVPDQRDIPTTYGKEMPDATPGDDRAGYPITAYFGTSRLKLSGHTLKAVAGSKNPGPVDCYEYDPQTGASANMTGYQRCVAIIPKDPLQDAATYEVTLQVEVDGKPWSRTWQFSTVGMARPRR
jgi:hypothetical protein